MSPVENGNRQQVEDGEIDADDRHETQELPEPRARGAAGNLPDENRASDLSRRTSSGHQVSQELKDGAAPVGRVRPPAPERRDGARSTALGADGDPDATDRPRFSREIRILLDRFGRRDEGEFLPSPFHDDVDGFARPALDPHRHLAGVVHRGAIHAPDQILGPEARLRGGRPGCDLGDPRLEHAPPHRDRREGDDREQPVHDDAGRDGEHTRP